MGNTAGIHVAPDVQTPVLGNNSNAHLESLHDSVATNLDLTISGGTVIAILLIVGAVVCFALWKMQKEHFNVFHRRITNLANWTKYPGDDSHHHVL